MHYVILLIAVYFSSVSVEILRFKKTQLFDIKLEFKFLQLTFDKNCR